MINTLVKIRDVFWVQMTDDWIDPSMQKMRVDGDRNFVTACVTDESYALSILASLFTLITTRTDRLRRMHRRRPGAEFGGRKKFADQDYAQNL